MNNVRRGRKWWHFLHTIESKPLKYSRVLAAKIGSYLLLSRCNWYTGHRAEDDAWMFYKSRWVSTVWSLASHAQTILGTGSWFPRGRARLTLIIMYTKKGCHIPHCCIQYHSKNAFEAAALEDGELEQSKKEDEWLGKGEKAWRKKVRLRPKKEKQTERDKSVKALHYVGRKG